MLNNLNGILEKHRHVQEELERPEIASDPLAARPLLKELKELTPLVEKIQYYLNLQQQSADTRKLLTESDPQMRALAEEEIEQLDKQLESVSEEIKTLLLPRDEADDRNAILEIRAGTGGEEAALFAADLLRMYSKFAESRRWKWEVDSLSEAEAGGIKEVIVEVRGEGAYGVLKWESGTHRVQRVPVTEAQGRIHTSAATVAVLPEAEEKDVQIKPDDLRIQVYRSSGAGGQHVNTTDSAVRITHIPTNIVVTMQDERSQIKNRAKAMKILTSKLLARARDEEAQRVSADRRSQVGSGDRSEKIRTYNYPQNRLTDHRVDLTLYKLDRILEGDLDEIIQALQLDDRTRKLQMETEAVAK
ncbi:peptide chain release factor 1 [candidate division KSB1 bacterium]|nr:MAG: peptide chain release factor 1 [candidate division KSB1 bacterium]